MGYSIEDCTGDPDQIEEIADFLAKFVADGEGPKNDEAGRRPETWIQRLTWWWEENPYHSADCPRALVLRRSDQTIAGFIGFVAHDYVIDGETVPTLILTTTFVREDSRDAVLGLWMRANRLREDYQLVDGGPSEAMEPLLDKTGYACEDGARLHFFPINRKGFGPRPLAMQAARVIAPKVRQPEDGLHLVSDLAEVELIPELDSSSVCRHVDLNSIRWVLNSGTLTKHFVGLVDDEGALVAYLIGRIRRKGGIRFFFVNDAFSFGESGETMIFDLAARVAQYPEEAAIPLEADVLVLPAKESNPASPLPLTCRYGAKVFYRMPSKWRDAKRTCLPFEGDAFLL
ncbi:MAG: hypothetical protein AAGA96_01305 [Verrucomicrobiota bacterium]